MEAKKIYLFAVLFLSLVACRSQLLYVHDDDMASTQAPADSLPHTMLFTGKFHADEVPADVDKRQWCGLFCSKDGKYRLSPTKAISSRVVDPIIDGDSGEKTGWHIEAQSPDSCIALIEQLPELKERTVEAISFEKNYIYPEDTLKFTYLDAEYTLYAAGKTKRNEKGEIETVVGYRLYIIAKIKGKAYRTLLATSMLFEEKMMQILFVGDIDGDGIIDLIIDTANHYNSLKPTLYLSTYAEKEKEQVLRAVARHIIVGC